MLSPPCVSQYAKCKKLSSLLGLRFLQKPEVQNSSPVYEIKGKAEVSLALPKERDIMRLDFKKRW